MCMSFDCMLIVAKLSSARMGCAAARLAQRELAAQLYAWR
jgi:hypothetical protein